MGSFFERTELLAGMVGDGDLTGTFAVFGGPRTVPLHQGYWVQYMGDQGYKKIRRYRDGGPRFVEDPLKERYMLHYEEMARVVLSGGVREAMEGWGKDMDDQLGVRAPIEFGALRKSGSYTVTDDGDPIAYKAPEAPPYE